MSNMNGAIPLDGVSFLSLALSAREIAQRIHEIRICNNNLMECAGSKENIHPVAQLLIASTTCLNQVFNNLTDLVHIYALSAEKAEE